MLCTVQFLAFKFNLRLCLFKENFFPFINPCEIFFLIFLLLRGKSIKIKIDFHAIIFSKKIWLVRILILFMQSNFLPLGEKFWQSVLVNDNQLCELGMYMPRRLIRCYDKSFSWCIPVNWYHLRSSIILNCTSKCKEFE